MGRLRTAGAIVASIARGATICTIALLCVIAYAAGSLRRLTIRDATLRARDRARQRGQLLRWCFSRLGATFIKVGQVMSSRPDLVAPPIIAELRDLQDRVRPFAFARVRAILERELGRPLSEVFTSLDPVPLAAGSIAQVHRGTLASGEAVAVKILRPDVRARVHRDARLLLWLAHVAHVVSARARAADAIAHVRNLVAGITVQTDLHREAENLDRFRADFAGVPHLAFPRVHHALSTSRVLTMELVHGVHLDHIDPAHIPIVTATLRSAFFAMCFDHGLVHADLHPGNILVGPDATVTILDVGLVKYLDAAAIARLVDLARCLVVGTPRDLVAHLRAHHPHTHATDWSAVARDTALMITRLRRATIADLELTATVGDLFALARRHHIRPLPELSLVLLGMVTIEGIAKRLDPSANTLAEVARYLAPRIAFDRTLARGSRRWSTPPLGLRAAPAEPAPPAGTPDAPSQLSETGRPTSAPRRSE